MSAVVADAEGFGAHLCKLRQQRGLTQQDMAGSRYSRQFISAIEVGERLPSDEAIIYFAERIGADPDDLRHLRPIGLVSELRSRIQAARRALFCGEVAESIAEFEDVEDSARHYNLTSLEGLARHCRGEAALHSVGAQAAYPHYLRAEEILVSESVASTAYTIARRAHCLVATGKIAEAVHVVENALATLRKQTPAEIDARVRLLTAVAEPYFEMGSYGRAIAVLDEALVLAPGVQEKEWIARLQLNAARAHFHRGQWALVEDALHLAQDIFTSLHFDLYVGKCRWSRGYLLARSGRLDEAAAELRAARTTLWQVKALGELNGPTVELATVLREQGELDEAATLAAEGVRLGARAGHVEWLAEAERLVGLIALSRGDVGAAESALRAAAALYARAGARIELAVTARTLAKVLHDRGEVDAALELMRTGLIAAEGAPDDALEVVLRATST